jgi:hypothetical protein
MIGGPVSVYLDSSDYSALTNPSQQSANTIEVCEKLRCWAKSGEVEFIFSGAHLSEMAPLEARYAPAAVARADLLVELCGRNAFISCDRLLASELMSIYQPLDCKELVVSRNAEWFPDIGDFISALKVRNQTINEVGRQHGLNRQQSSQLKLTLFKNSQPGITSDVSDSYREILASYPMREQYAKVISQYVFGTVTAEQAKEAFIESLRDPRWMMCWFATNFEKVTPFSSLVRAPSQILIAIVQDLAAQIVNLRTSEKSLGTNYVSDYITLSNWKKAQDKLFVNVATRLQPEFLKFDAPEPTVETLDEKCPGFSAFIRSFLWSVRSSVSESPRSPKNSDFVDAIHAMYAPYVDVFRADSYMTPHIERVVSRHGTIVVPNINALLLAIESKLKESTNLKKQQLTTDKSEILNQAQQR